MTAFPKAAIQNVLLGADLNVRLWPKPAVQMLGFEDCEWLLMTQSGHSTFTLGGMIYRTIAE